MNVTISAKVFLFGTEREVLSVAKSLVDRGYKLIRMDVLDVVYDGADAINVEAELVKVMDEFSGTPAELEEKL